MSEIDISPETVERTCSEIESEVKAAAEELRKHIRTIPMTDDMDSSATNLGSDAGGTTAGDGWRPIETAPRDGSAFLGWVRFGFVVTIWFDVSDQQWFTPVREDGRMRMAEPTHWMPMPPPPSPLKTE